MISRKMSKVLISIACNRQFAKALWSGPRVEDKMLVETMDGAVALLFSHYVIQLPVLS